MTETSAQSLAKDLDPVSVMAEKAKSSETRQYQTESGVSTNPPGSIPGGLTSARSCQFLPMEQFFGERITAQALYPLALGVTDDETVEKAKMACPSIRLTQLQRLEKCIQLQ